MSSNIEYRVYDAQELKAEAIRRWPQREMQLAPNVVLDEVMPIAGVVRNGLFIVQVADEWSDLSPYNSLIEFLERYYETTDAADCLSHAELEQRDYGADLTDFCERMGISVDDLPKHPSMIRKSQKKSTKK